MLKILKRLKFLDYLIIVATFACVLVQTYLEMEFIGFTKEMLSLVGVTKIVADYWQVGYKMLIVTGIMFIAIIFKNILASHFSSRIARDLRKDVFAKVNSFSSFEINKFSTSSLITRSTNDVSQIQRTLCINRQRRK